MRTWPSKVTASTRRADERDAAPSNAPTPPGSSTACRPCAPRRGRSVAAAIGNARNSSAPLSSRSAGRRQVSACTAALTSSHHAAAASFHTARSSLSSGTGGPLRIADEMLDDSLRLRIGRMTEVRSEPVVGREPDIVRRRDHHVGHRPALQATHPIGEHLGRNTAEHLEALGEQRHRRRRGLVASEPHEPEPAPRHHRAEHLHPAGQRAPIDHQRLARHPHRRTTLMTRLAARHARFAAATPADGSSAATPRNPAARADRQQPLRRDLRLRLSDHARATRSRTTSVFFATAARPARSSSSSPASWASTLRFTVFGSTPHISAAPRYVPDVSIRGNNIHVLPR